MVTMDIPIAIHVDSRGLESLGPRSGKLELQARSLRNTLGVLKRRLKGMKADKAHTVEDVKHYKVCCLLAAGLNVRKDY